jgi:drug/metabolite transporter (DMT)-like permease
VSALLALVVSSLAWAALDMLRKQLVAHLPAPAVAAFLSVGLAPLFLGGVLLYGQGRLEGGYLLPGLAAAVLSGAGIVLFCDALRRGPLSTGVPLLSLTPVFASLMGAVLIGELLSARQWAGVLLVMAGAVALQVRGTAIRFDRAGASMVAVAFIWALTAVFDKQALRHADPAMHGFLQCAAVGGGLLAWPTARAPWRELRPVRGVLLLAIGLGAVALLLQFVALASVLVAAVETVKRAVGVLAALVVGKVVFGEPVTALKVGAALAMAAGVVLLLA